MGLLCRQQLTRGRVKCCAAQKFITAMDGRQDSLNAFV